MHVHVQQRANSLKITSFAAPHTEHVLCVQDRFMAIGAIADTCSHLKAHAAPYIPHMLPILAAGLKGVLCGVWWLKVH